MSRNKHLTIQEYLDGPKNWEDGLNIYLKYGNNEALKAMFVRSGGTNYNQGKLIEELKALMPSSKPESKVSQSKTPYARAVVSAPGVATLGLSKDDPRLKELYRERQHLHAQLMIYRTDRERKEAAFRIMDITEQIDKLQTRFEPVKQEYTESEMMRRLLNNRAYISKNRKNQNKQEEVQKRIDENHHIEKILNKKGK